jgi:hypothetical protein
MAPDLDADRGGAALGHHPCRDKKVHFLGTFHKGWQNARK